MAASAREDTMRRLTATALATLLATQALAADTSRNPLTDSASWTELQDLFLPDTEIAAADGVFDVDAPYRAENAATVPIVIRQTDPDATITGAMVVIDENPAPMAAEMTFSEAMLPLEMELRVRVDQYSNVRVIARTEGQGALMAGRFVKASGGCSAPAGGDKAAALATMGQMKLRHFGAGDGAAISTPRREAQIMIRHPNYSGLSRDQITHLFVQPHFIDRIEVYQGEDLLWSLTGGISISEDPVFRFSYADNGSTALTVKAHDTEGNLFEQTLPKSPES